MAKYIGSSCRMCRREGEKLFLKGSKCATDKCAVARREYAPGQHGRMKMRKKDSNYNIQLREKQKVKRVYGMLERQFKHYFRIAQESHGVTGLKLLELLERRLDNVIFRMNLAQSRAHARQIVQHGQVFVNSKRVDIPSFLVGVKDIVELRPKEKALKQYRERLELLKDRQIPEWITHNAAKFTGTIVALPTKENVGFPVQEQLIVELYSK
ncbi:MAG: 30S ribosomal protein S4 [Candidatus Omnitrophota bacterium]